MGPKPTCSPPEALPTGTTPLVSRRRDFLKLLVVAGATATAVALPREGFAKRRRRRSRGKLVFRLQTRKHYSCGACKRHHRFTIFRTQAIADGHRAHPGCNCPIVPQKIHAKQFKRLFGPKGIAPGGVIDVRTTPLSKRPLEPA